MANKYQVVDEILKDQGQGTYNVTFTELNVIHEDDATLEQERVEVIGAITDEVKSHLQLSYDDLEEAPGIPEEGIINGEFQDFNKVAFTGDFNDLNNKPIEIRVPEDTENSSPAYETVEIDGIQVRQLKALDESAFTGIGSGAGSSSQVLDLTNYSLKEEEGMSSSDPESYTSKLRNLGNETIFLKGFNEAPISSGLATDIGTFFSNFQEHKTPSYFVSSSGVYFVLNAQRVTNEARTLTRYCKFELALVNEAEFTHYIGGTATTQNYQDMLDSIDLSSRLVCFIFDWTNKAVYCKTDSVGSGVINYEDLAGKPTLFSGDYEDLNGKPILDASDSETDISGLATIATTGSYDDLDDTTYIVNFSQFVQKYDSGTDTYTAITGTEYNNIYSLGLNNVYIENINTIYNTMGEEDISLKDAILNLVTEFFDNNKKCKFITNYNQEISIENIQRNYSGNNLDYIIIESSSIIQSNYRLLLAENNYTKQQILEQYFYNLFKTNLICDFNTNTIYVHYHSYYPILNSDNSIVVNSSNVMAVKISSKPNNQLQLISENGQEGLYVNNI